MGKVKKELKKIIKIISKQELRILPGQLAFFLVLSIIPIITLLVFIASFFNISMTSLIEFLSGVLPKEIKDIIIPIFSGKGMDVHLGISMIVGFVIASNGAYSIIVSSNTLYKFNSSNYIKRRIKALILIILLIIIFLLTLTILGFGNKILLFILNFNIFKKFTKVIYSLIVLLKTPVALLLIFIFMKIIYMISPDKYIPSKYTTEGALFTTLGWTVVTIGYSYYVSTFSNYDLFYGSLSNIVVLIMWLYFLSYIFVIGLAINSSKYDINSSKYDMEKKGEHN